MAWLANYLAKWSRQTRLTEIIHNTKTYTTKPKETKLTLVQEAFYAIRPGNGLGLFYTSPETHTGHML